MIGSLSGIVTTPSDHDPENERLPVIVFLHGAGENGDGSAAHIDRVRAHGIPKYFGADADHRGLRVITVSPQCPEELIWGNITLQLKDYIDAAVAYFKGDPAKVAVTGISMGGFGTFKCAMMNPDKYAAAMCMSSSSS